LYVTIITEFKSGRQQLKPSFLHKKYIEEGLSLRQISAQTASSKEAIRSALIKNNIPVRDKGQHHGNPSQLKYGVKRKGLSSVEHKAEQRTVDAVGQMRDEGLSLRAIARCLNQMRVPTKNRGVKWHPEMVRRISS
jgi:hypothetical protein